MRASDPGLHDIIQVGAVGVNGRCVERVRARGGWWMCGLRWVCEWSGRMVEVWIAEDGGVDTPPEIFA